MRPIRLKRSLSGFTLIEMIVVITITSILVAVVAIFIRNPINGIVDTVRRAGLADTADSALRRMRRDVQRALPNSVRFTSSGSNYLIEFLPTLSGGRYCSDVGTTVGGSACTALDFSSAITSVSYIGAIPGWGQGDVTAANIKELAIYNLGISGANAYAGDNTATFSAINTTTSVITIASMQFPYPSPGNRFQLIGGPVTYVCAPATTGNDGSGTLTRISGYSKQSTQPTNPAGLTGAVSNILASNVSSCAVDYQQAAIDQYGLLSVTLGLKRNGEQVVLTHEMQINNAP